jgi:putative transposase
LRGENCLYHVMSRGNDRKRIFLKHRDYERFLEYVLAAKDRFRFFLYAFCLMPNHYHLLLETALPNISSLMQYINGSYTTYHNTKYRRCGHLFQGRFKSIVVDKDHYFLELSRYIHLNPVRDKIVSLPDQYLWSSYRGYIHGKDKYVDLEKVERYLPLSRQSYKRFVLDGIDEGLDPLENVYAGFLLGSPSFIKAQLRHLGNQIKSKEVSHRAEMSRDPITEQAIIKAVARRFKITLESLLKEKSRPMRARQIAIYLLRRYSTLTNREIGEKFGLGHSAVSKAGLHIERLIAHNTGLRRKVEQIISNFEV